MAKRSHGREEVGPPTLPSTWPPRESEAGPLPFPPSSGSTGSVYSSFISVICFSRSRGIPSEPCRSLSWKQQARQMVSRASHPFRRACLSPPRLLASQGPTA